METRKHNYGIQCRLAPVAASHDEDGTPQLRAQYFYSSTITIDDPFWNKTKPAGAEKRGSKGLLQPFGQGDNNMLEKTWVGMTSETASYRHKQIRMGALDRDQISAMNVAKRSAIIKSIAAKHIERHKGNVTLRHQPSSNSLDGGDSTPNVCCSKLKADVTEEFQKHFCSMVRQVDPSLDQDAATSEIAEAVRKAANPPNYIQRPDGTKKTNKSQGSTATAQSPIPTGGHTHRHGHDLGQRGCTVSSELASTPKSTSISPAQGSLPRAETPTSVSGSRPGTSGDGITGMPFARVKESAVCTDATSSSACEEGLPCGAQKRHHTQYESTHLHTDCAEEGEVKPDEGGESAFDVRDRAVSVTVGASKLHTVVLPEMQMKPIYWSPVNDVVAVTRATWFYRDTMLPVSSRVANMLEAGYQDLRPWTDVWREELACALRIGAEAEEKIAHKLWPKAPTNSRGPKNLPRQPAISTDHYCAAHCFRENAATDPSIECMEPDNDVVVKRPFSNYAVLFKDKRHAFLLNQSLQPSTYYDKRPLAKIMKGLTVGIPVVRGFSRKAWERLRDRDKIEKPTDSMSTLDEPDEETDQKCYACEDDKDRGQITDLVLVAHGIGQKFAERVESFHFTHAINTFRRSVNQDLQNPRVQKVLRKDQNGLMILPLNWRVGLTFEGGAPLRGGGDGTVGESFDLKDIEPDTIPAVRSMISDVMFDIPFYMSHHKDKMITALVSEANRVYRLWCRNNPGFAEKGRVHIIAHSLGSVMTVDILSRQPSTALKTDLNSSALNTKFFEFNTTNLFLVGSPVGFFLLLEKGMLIPRQGRQKPGANSDDIASDKVAGEAGTFGCLAVDNVYNILAKEDPIAYLLTGAVDAKYAAGLEKAYVPSTAQSWMKAMGYAMRRVVPGMAKQGDNTESDLEPESEERPSAARLPSQLELEIHDFTKEEIAEKKAYLLNDNGQIDWFLRSTGGPLEIQYLNMLSAHTSYWNNRDFIRLVCLEIGRKPGRANTLRSMRAVKTERRTPKFKDFFELGAPGSEMLS